MKADGFRIRGNRAHVRDDLDQLRVRCLDDPADVRAARAERRDGGNRVDHVTEGGEADDEQG